MPRLSSNTRRSALATLIVRTMFSSSGPPHALASSASLLVDSLIQGQPDISRFELLVRHLFHCPFLLDSPRGATSYSSCTGSTTTCNHTAPLASTNVAFAQVWAGVDYIIVAGSLSQSASLNFTITCHPMAWDQPNDECPNAIAIGDGVHSFDASHSTDSVPPGTVLRDQWFTYTASCTGALTLTFIGDDAGNSTVLVPIASPCTTTYLTSPVNGAGMSRSFTVAQGMQYHIRAGPFSVVLSLSRHLTMY